MLTLFTTPIITQLFAFMSRVIGEYRSGHKIFSKFPHTKQPRELLYADHNTSQVLSSFKTDTIKFRQSPFHALSQDDIICGNPTDE